MLDNIKANTLSLQGKYYNHKSNFIIMVIQGLKFRTKLEKTFEGNKTDHVQFQNGMFTGVKSMPVEDFQEMVRGWNVARSRNGHFLEPLSNKTCDNEIYPA